MAFIATSVCSGIQLTEHLIRTNMNDDTIEFSEIDASCLYSPANARRSVLRY
jgi:hypothetical protein